LGGVEHVLNRKEINEKRKKRNLDTYLDDEMHVLLSGKDVFDEEALPT
jgi:hypothetical protein